jgi:ankyrin repeat protein
MGAAAAGHLDAMKLLIDHGADPNGVDGRGHGALVAAAASGQIDAAKLLLDRGARVGYEALLHAAASGQTAAVKLLLDHGADPAENDGERSPLGQASIANHAQVVLLLLDRGAPLNRKLRAEASLVSNAAANGNLALLKELLHRGARYRDGDDEGLERAATEGHVACLQLLLDQGLRPHRLDELIKKTVELGQFQTALALFRIRRQARPLHAATSASSTTQEKANPAVNLLIAAYEDNGPEIKRLLGAARGADPLLLSSARTFALQRGNIAALRLIAPAADQAAKTAAEKAELNRRLIDIAGDGNLKLMASLLQRGADANATDPDKIGGPLTHAVKSGRIDAVKLLLDHGAQINRRFAEVTALGSVRKNDLDMARFLLAHGADPNIPSYSTTPLFRAAEDADLPMIQLLLDAKAHIDQPAEYTGDTPLIYVAENGKADVVKFLLEKGADLTIKNKKGNTAMDLALANGKMDVAALLRRRGAPPHPTTPAPTNRAH